MDIYFVIDVRNRKAVIGERGERSGYKEVHERSILLDRSDVEYVVDKIRPKNLYVADLDRIEGVGDNIDIIERINVEKLIADCGFRSIEEAMNLNFTPVLGTETFNVLELKDGDFIMSVDLKGGLLDKSGKFRRFEEMLRYLNSFKLSGVLILPIHSVGTLHYDFKVLEKALDISDHKILTGGGFKTMQDLYMAKELGVSGVLIATAIHKGLIDVDVVRRGRI